MPAAASRQCRSGFTDSRPWDGPGRSCRQQENPHQGRLAGQMVRNELGPGDAWGDHGHVDAADPSVNVPVAAAGRGWPLGAPGWGRDGARAECSHHGHAWLARLQTQWHGFRSGPVTRDQLLADQQAADPEGRLAHTHQHRRQRQLRAARQRQEGAARSTPYTRKESMISTMPSVRPHFNQGHADGEPDSSPSGLPKKRPMVAA